LSDRQLDEIKDINLVGLNFLKNYSKLDGGKRKKSGARSKRRKVKSKIKSRRKKSKSRKVKSKIKSRRKKSKSKRRKSKSRK
jgi:hypothetical protein